MHAAPWALALALAALSTSAHAADIDDVTSSAAAESASVDQEIGKQARKPKRRRAVRGRTHPGPSTRRPPARPAPARPAPARPVRRAPPPRQAAPVRRAAPRRVVQTRPVVVRRVTPASGVFVYGPPPRYHRTYRGAPGPVPQAQLPARQVDRGNTLTLGIKGGSFLSGTNAGAIYADPGLGLMARYRPVESVGLQLDVTHHSSAIVDRAQTQAAASLALFAYPWSRVSPYVLGGATWNGTSVFEDGVGHRELLTGLHGGLGMHFGIGQRVGLEFEGKYIGYLGRAGRDPLGALQGTAGLSFQL